MKKYLMALLVALFIPTSVLAAPEGPQPAPGWQTLYNDWIWLVNQGTDETKYVVYSGGGDLQINFSGVTAANNFDVVVWEEDESGNPPEQITRYTCSGSCSKTIDVRSFVDGSNGKAEIRVGTSYARWTEQVLVQIND
ncbi:hypothetical protein [Cytobacillus praedii]|uniref:hypothetical protein n=1 Tax=Cytobacillus praedii TaxID=1742358 RepID=UPI002E24AB76|nr:hypothetical protein [Cytobacillus praedii]